VRGALKLGWIKASMAYRNGKFERAEGISIERGKISDFGVPDKEPEIDLSGLIVLPGFIDIHVHGGAGFDVMDGTFEAIDEISRHKLKEGVTSFCPTTVTSTPEKTKAAINSVVEAKAKGVAGAYVIGTFLEGPFICQKFKGAHPEEWIKEIDLEEIEKLVDLGEGTIVSCAIAPELPGAIDAIKLLKRRNVNARIGHSAATCAEALEGIKVGGTVAIHTFNAMSPFTHREAGLAGAAMDSDDVYCELVCDFIHTSVQAASILRKLKGRKLVLITDCMRAGGMADGDYYLGELSVKVKNSIARTETGALAGSTLTMHKAVKNFSQAAGATLEEAIYAATEAPAKAIGIDGIAGTLDIGKRADIIAVDEDFNLRFVMVGGEVKIERSDVAGEAK
jgi:N-acetylglucosamine-6-phosphate deacetylase